MELQKKIEGYLGKAVNGASNKEIYYALLKLVKEMCKDKEPNKGSKKIYYISFACISAESVLKCVKYLDIAPT